MNEILCLYQCAVHGAALQCRGKPDSVVITGSQGAVNVTFRTHKWACVGGEAAMPRMSVGVLSAALILEVLFGSGPSCAQSGLDRVNHIIIVMQENHSFDNYFGALPYVPGGAYHAPDPLDHDADGGCRADDHRCVDGPVG
jgi:hypothetical protein